jgi:hypothetical protein
MKSLIRAGIFGSSIATVSIRKKNMTIFLKIGQNEVGSQGRRGRKETLIALLVLVE